MTLKEIIIQKIKKEGPLCFNEFMEMCLYFPGLGFYTSPGNKIGKDGAFYTSAYLTPIFGALIGKQLAEMRKTLGNAAFTIVEYGAGTGILCHDILSYLKNNNREMYDQLNYYIIEKSPVMKEIERKYLPEKVTWIDAIEHIPKINGCIFSNELVDNFAVHQIVMEDELMEVFIDYDTDIKEILQPASPALCQYLEELEIKLPKGYRTEINLQATNWISEVAAALNQGYVMTIDYGYLSSELYKPCRSEGTLMCYNNHTTNSSLYEFIGEQDITSHVNFSALCHWGTKNGLKKYWFTDQCHFLLSLGFNDFLQQAFKEETDIIQAARKAAVLSHTLLIDMGTRFKILIQEKGINEKV